MDVPHCLGTEALGLSSCLHPVYPALGEQLLVELLQIQRSEFFQRNISDIGVDVVADVPLVGLVGGGSDFDLGIVLEPYLHPLPPVYFPALMMSRAWVSPMACFSFSFTSA